MTELTPRRLRELMTYDPYTGLFTNRFGQVLGSGQTRAKYIRIAIDNKMYLAHRLAWFWIHDEWPAYDLDHIDGNGQNNAIINLQQLDVGTNLRKGKQYKNNKTGNRGVMFETRRGKYKSQITYAGKNYFIGYFSTAEEAHEAYLKKLKELRGF